MDGTATEGVISEPGLYLNLSRQAYDDIPARNKSKIWLANTSLSKYRYYSSLTTPREDTDDLRFGRLFDNWLLEPETRHRFVRFEGKDRRGNAWKDFVRKCELVNQIPMLAQDLDRFEAMGAGIQRCGSAKLLMDNLESVQPSIVWRCRHTKQLLKGRMDFTTKSEVVDIKTTRRQPTFDDMRWDIVKYGYHVQASMYIDGMRELGHTMSWFILAINKYPPYDCGTIHLNPGHLDYGRQTYIRLINDIVEAEKTGFWPGVAESHVNRHILLPGQEDEDDRVIF